MKMKKKMVKIKNKKALNALISFCKRYLQESHYTRNFYAES